MDHKRCLMVIGMAALALPVFADDADEAVRGKVRHELSMMPRLTVFDYLEFRMDGPTVILTGYTVRPTNKTEAERRVKAVEGVEVVTNEIEVLPLGRDDRLIQGAVHMNLKRVLPKYFYREPSNIRIIVKRGHVILKGHVDSERDRKTAEIHTKSARGVFGVTNDLVVTPAGSTGSGDTQVVEGRRP